MTKLLTRLVLLHWLHSVTPTNTATVTVTVTLTVAFTATVTVTITVAFTATVTVTAMFMAIWFSWRHSHICSCKRTNDFSSKPSRHKCSDFQVDTRAQTNSQAWREPTTIQYFFMALAMKADTHSHARNACVANALWHTYTHSRKSLSSMRLSTWLCMASTTLCARNCLPQSRSRTRSNSCTGSGSKIASDFCAVYYLY